MFGKKEFPEIKVIPQVPEIPPGVEKAQPVPGASAQLTKPVVDDQTGQVLVTSTTAQDPSVTLPLTEEEIERGLAYALAYSVRWLAEWCFRLLKRAGLKLEKKKRKE
jgi:hypothetical protein